MAVGRGDGYVVANLLYPNASPSDLTEAVVPHEEFIEQYAQAIERGGTVYPTRGTAHLPLGNVEVLFISTAETTIEARGLMGMANTKISPEDAREAVQKAIDQNAAHDRFKAKGTLEKAADVSKFILGKDSDYRPKFLRPDPVPKVIVLERLYGAPTTDVIVDEDVARIITGGR